MPTIARIGPYRLYFSAGDRDEPDDGVARFWLAAMRLQRASGFRATELRYVERIVEEHQERLLEAWHDYFDR